jgi:hypothetical protein
MSARMRTLLVAVAMTAVFLFNWILRYNEPEGSFGGLTDDHLFYLLQSWQMLFGEFPDRDYNDIGAPLTFATSAALQVLLGRSVWSEYVFCVTALSVGAALTCALAARATGSILLGVLAALFEIALRPRLYNYPKIIVYALGIALLWHWISEPRPRRTWLLAAVTAFGFLMRHDHGVYIAGAFGIALLAMNELSWRERVRHGLTYGIATIILLTPYLTHLQINGGVVRHFAMAYGWSARDYRRAPLVVPVPSLAPLSATADSDEPPGEWWERPPFAALGDLYYTWWMYWLMVLLPPFVLLLLIADRSTGPPRWRGERAKMLAIAGLTIVLDARLLRGNLAGRFADVSVPMAILVVWALATVFRLATSWRPAGDRALAIRGARALALVSAMGVVLFTAGVLAKSTGELVKSSSLLEGIAAMERDARVVTRLVSHTWPLDSWTNDTTGQIGLAKYLQACTAPTDRVLIGPFVPPVLALAQRGFAGGRIDLRGGFFDSPAEQQLTIERMRRQSVPIVIGPPRSGLELFTSEFPVIAEYLRREYRAAAEADLGGDLTFSLLVHRHARATGTYEPLQLPCFR